MEVHLATRVSSFALTYSSTSVRRSSFLRSSSSRKWSARADISYTVGFSLPSESFTGELTILLSDSPTIDDGYVNS